MSNYEKEASIRPTIFDGSNFIYWKVRITAYLQSLGIGVWDIVEIGYTFPLETPTDTTGKKQYETNAKAVNTLLGSLSQSEFVKVKRAKLQTLRIQYESLRMHNDESVASYFLCIDEIVNCMKNLGEEIKEVVVVEKVLRSLSPKFDSKVYAIEEKDNLKNLTMSQLHRILTTYEMRKGGPSNRREVAFKVSGKVDHYEPGHMSEEEEESNFVKNLQRGTRRFRGKLPFKCFACGRVGHYAAKCPHKDKLDKGKEPVRWNRRQNKKSYYTHEDSDGLSNNDEDEQGNDNRLLMAFEDDDFLDAINEEGLYEEIAKIKVCLKEKNMIIDTLIVQLAKNDKHNEGLECEIVGLRKEIEKTKALNLRFAKRSETLDEIIKVQHSPLIKIGLGYSEEASQAQKQTQKSSTSKSYLEAARRKEQVDNQKHNADHQVNQGQFASRMIKYYQVNQGQSTSRMNRSLNQPQKKVSANNLEGASFIEFQTWRKKEPQPESCGIALYSEGQENQWYIDIRCSKHMTSNKEKLQSYTALEKEKKVSFGNDTPTFIEGKGSVQLKEKVKARNVMYVDGLKHNLLSVSQMCDQGTEVIFRSNGCIVREVDTGKTMIRGIRTPNNLYVLKGEHQQCYLSKNDEHWLWHKRLGHLSFSQIRKACRYQAVRDLPDIRILDNKICK
eukprot:PITA_12822